MVLSVPLFATVLSVPHSTAQQTTTGSSVVSPSRSSSNKPIAIKPVALSLTQFIDGVPKEMKDADIDEREIDKVEAIALSMTSEERINPDIIDSSRRTRIANGSGTTPAQVGNLLKQFKEMRKMMKGMAGMGTKPKGRKDKGKKSKKGKKGPGRTGGGRVQSKEIQQVPNANIDGLDLTLPGR